MNIKHAEGVAGPPCGPSGSALHHIAPVAIVALALVSPSSFLTFITFAAHLSLR